MGRASNRKKIVRITITGGAVAEAVRASVKATAGAGRSVALTRNVFTDLVAELGGGGNVLDFVRMLATETRQPIAINMPNGDATATALVGPEGWSDERLRGYLGGIHEELAEEFGPIAGVVHPGGADG